MWNKVISFITSFFEPIFHNDYYSLKRSRESDNDVSETVVTPCKKRKLLEDITHMDINIDCLRNTHTQTDCEVTSVNIKSRIKLISPARPYTSDNFKENWSISNFQNGLSPRKKFNAPSHCKSPVKVKSIPMSEDVQYLGAIPKNIPSRKNSSSLMREQTSLMLLNGSTPSFSMAETFPKIPSSPTKEEYSFLLGTYAKNHSPVQYVEPSIVGTVDLTKDDDDSDVVELGPRLSHNKMDSSVRKLVTPRASAQLFPPIFQEQSPIISVEDDSDEVKVEKVIKKVPRVNSFEQKLVKNPYASATWLDELCKKYERTLSTLEKNRQMLSQETELVNERYQKYMKQRIEKRIEQLLKTDEYVIRLEEKEFALPELTPEMKERVKAALKPEPASEVLSEHFNLTIRRRDIHTLRGLNWLNDEIINFYMTLLMERAKQGKYRSAYAFNTFFYPKLIKQGYDSLRRWTRKVDIFTYDLILVPVHLQMHWCMAVIDLKKKCISYYDSMGSANDKCLVALLKYLISECKDKKSEVMDTDDWKLMNATGIPLQMNGSDCGVFACTFAEYVCRGAPFRFSQSDMPYFREKMVYEILTGRLLNK